MKRSGGKASNNIAAPIVKLATADFEPAAIKHGGQIWRADQRIKGHSARVPSEETVEIELRRRPLTDSGEIGIAILDDDYDLTVFRNKILQSFKNSLADRNHGNYLKNVCYQNSIKLLLPSINVS